VSPLIYLSLVLVVLAGVIGQAAVRGQICRRRLLALAQQWNMHFAPGDRLRLSKRVTGSFPIPGAANIRVRDLFYRTEESLHQYLFTIDYTVGAIRGKVGRSCVAGFQEPVSRAGPSHHRSSSPELVVEQLSSGMTIEGAYGSVMTKLNSASNKTSSDH